MSKRTPTQRAMDEAYEQGMADAYKGRAYRPTCPSGFAADYDAGWTWGKYLLNEGRKLPSSCPPGDVA